MGTRSLLGACPTGTLSRHQDRGDDRRAACAYPAIGMSPAMANRVVGAGSQYIWTPRDGSDANLDGGKSYRLHLPPNIPVVAFWSMVVYDPESRSMLRHGQPFPSVSQYTDPVVNDDGSVDVWFGPESLKDNERSWITIVPGQGLIHHHPLLRPATADLRSVLEAGRHRIARETNATAVPGTGFINPWA